MVDYVKKLERLMTTVLMGLMAIVVVLAIADLGWVLLKDIVSPPLVKAVPSVSLLGIAAIIVGLGITYYLVRRMRNPPESPQAPEDA